MTAYDVPAAPAEVELRFKNSRFIGTAGRAASPEEAHAFVDTVRKRYPDASHHVYAFAAGYGGTVTHGMSDAGEPSGTAGRPALAVVQGADLGDLVVVITRYFGGTKLGTGGLVRAYTQTAQAAIAATRRERKRDLVTFQLLLGYEVHATCRRLVLEEGAEITDEEYGARVRLQAVIDSTHLDALQDALQEATAGQVAPTDVRPV